MIKNFALKLLCLFSGIVLICSPFSAIADEIMDRIERTGEIRVGWRSDSTPFAFKDPNTGEYVGFSVDMTDLLVEKLSEHFGKKIEIVPLTVTTRTRIPMIAKGTIDIEMGSTTFNQKRNETVDFSLIFFFSETTFLVSEDSGIKTDADLNTKKLGAAKDSTNLNAIKESVSKGDFSPTEIIEAETHDHGLADLLSGRIDAYCTDRSLLEGLRMKAPNPDNWRVADFSIAYEPYAYMMREGNSDFRDFVNNTIIWSIKSGQFFEIYDKWMGTKPVKKLENKSQSLITKARNINIGIMAGTVIFIGLIVFFYGRRLTGKIRHLSEVSNRISMGDLESDIEIRSRDEVGELADAISRMQISIRLSLEMLEQKR